jgi:chemotaxis methyl-accepting protein methylase/chemotaxis receptor (MCP) glutamine deamidase CheD
MTTNKTSFFREPYQFDWLKSEYFPALIKGARAGGPRRVRVWSAGCSTGAEPYTMAMLMREVFEPGWEISILATDIDTDVLAVADAGEYDANQIDGLDKRWLSRHFLRGRGAAQGRFKVRPELRKMVTFKQLNLIEPWTLRTRFELILCRNVSIYFNRATQTHLFGRLGQQLVDGGYLLVGHSECLAGMGLPLEPRRGNMYHKGAGVPAAARSARDTVSPRVTVGAIEAASSGSLVARVADSTAVCIYDSAEAVGGLAHVAAGRSSKASLERLLARLTQLGAEASRLEAKVVSSSAAAVESVRETLSGLGVPLVNQRVIAGAATEVRFMPAARRVRLSRQEQP